MPKCDKCDKEVQEIAPMIKNNEDTEMLCPSCWGYADARADYEYERAKEEGIC